MPVTGGVTRNDYIASAGQTVFAYTFEILSNSDLKVLKNGVELSLTTDYLVTGVGSDTGGNMLLTSPAFAGDKIAILLAMPITRTTQYQNSGDFLASDVNADFDKTYIAMNQLQTDIARSIGLQDEEDSATLELPLAANRANKVLGFDGDGNVIATTSSGGGGGGDFLPLTGGALTGPVTTTSTFDGRDVSADGTKLDGIEAGATADQTPAQIKTAYESNSNTNAFTDADQTKLGGIETGADVTDTTNVVASLSAGTGISLSAGGEISNTAPDQIVALTGAGGTTVTGTYPNFTVTSTGGGGGNETLAQTLVLGNTTGGTDLSISSGDNIIMAASSTVDGRDLSVDGTKLDGIEASADVTDTDNVVASLTAGNNITIAADGTISSTGSGGGGETLAQTLVLGNATGGTDIAFADNDKATFGGNTDLEIYHDGNNSYVVDDGTGNLFIGGSSYVDIGNGVIGAGGQTYARFNTSGSCQLNYNNVDRLETTNSGILVNGTVNGRNISSDGVKLDGIEALADVTDTDNVVASLTAGTNITIAADGTISSTGGTGGGETLAQTLAIGNTTGGADIVFGDNDKATFGLSADLEIYHDTLNSYVKDSGTGNLFVGGTNYVEIGNGVTGAGGQTYARFNTSGSCDLKYNNSNKLSTTNTGIDVTGTITFDGGTSTADLSFGVNDKALFGGVTGLEVYHDGTDGRIVDTGAGDLYVQASDRIVFSNTANTEIMAIFNEDGAISLRYNGTEKFLTTATGINVIGTVEFNGLSGTGAVTVTDILDEDTMASNSATALATQQSIKTYVDTYVANNALTTSGGTLTGDLTLNDNVKANFGTSADLEIFHDGSNSYVGDYGTGNLFIGGTNYVDIGNGISGLGGQTYARFNTSGSCQLNYNGVDRLTTTTSGVDVNGAVNLTSGASDWAFSVVGNDLVISYGGSNKAKLDTSGNLTVVGNVTAYGTI